MPTAPRKPWLRSAIAVAVLLALGWHCWYGYTYSDMEPYSGPFDTQALPQEIVDLMLRDPVQ